MKAVAKVLGKSVGSNLKKILFIGVALVLLGNACFSADNKFAEMKRHYKEKKFSAVVNIFKNMSISERKYTYDDNEEEILLMAARSRAEIIKYQREIEFTSREIERIFYRLLELNQKITINDLHMPGNNKKAFINSFRNAYQRLFGKLVIKSGKPGVDIKIDGQYKFTTQKGNEPVELFLWVGLNKIYKAYEVALEYDSPKYEEIKSNKVLIMPGKVKHLRVKFKRKLTLEKTHLLLALEQNAGTYSRRFNQESLKFIQPLRDISAFELGIGISDTGYLSVKYGKNYNLFISENGWQGKDINEYLDYNITNLEIYIMGGKDYTAYDPGTSAVKIGYKNLKIEHVDNWGNKLNSTYNLYVNDFYYNSRSNSRNAIFIQLGGGYILGASKIEFFYNNEKLAPSFFCAGILLSAELGGSLNRRFDISFGASFELFYSTYTGDKYDWLPEDLTTNLAYILKGFTKLTFRF